MKISSLNKGLVGHWTMAQDSLKGSLLADKTPYENDGTIYGATFSTDRKGKANSAMSFDGVDDYISGSNLLYGETECSISYWCKKSNIDGQISVGILDGALKRVELFWYIDGKIYGEVGDTENIWISYPATVEDTEWHFLTMIYDGSGVSNYDKIKLYFDGTELTTSPGTAGTISSIIETTGVLTIGKRSTGYSSGSIDDVRIYNRALSEKEITLLYESYKPSLTLYGGDKAIKEDGFIRVDKNVNNAEYFEDPDSNLYGKTYFYVMQYQARNNGGVPQSTGDGLPWTSINQLDAIQKSKDAGYHLITNWEWMAIARDIEDNPANWSTGQVGNGLINRGFVNTSNTGPAANTGPTYLYNTGANALSSTGTHEQKRTHILSNGEEIWDFSGNVWEWVDDTIAKANLPSTAEWTEFSSAYYNTFLQKSKVIPVDESFNSSKGVGKIYYGSNTNDPRAFLRGGAWGDGASAGVFTLNLLSAPSSSSAGIGFRCAQYGNEQ